MRGWAIVLALVAGCYHGPTTDSACSIACTDTCPGDLTCTHGVCAGSADPCAPTFSEVHAGDGFACALDSHATLWCWGANDHHEVDSSAAASVPLATWQGQQHWDAIATGGGHVCGIHDDQLFCWGRNDHAQITSAIPTDVATPTQIQIANGPARWTAVATGYDDTCAIGDGKLWCWGNGVYGQLGTGDTTSYGTPTPVMTSITDWTMVATGYEHTCAVSASAGVSCWGYNGDGEVGDGTNVERDAPVAVTGLPGAVTSLAAGLSMSCATTDALQLYCWGNSTYSELGDPALVTASSLVPVLSTQLTGWTSVASAEQFSCALRDDEVWCFGRALLGGMGDGLWSQVGTWVRIANGASAISVGLDTNLDTYGPFGNDSQDLDLACMIIDGAIQCWGDNRFGQLAQGTVTEHPAPIEVSGGHVWSAIGAGTDHVCGLEGSTVSCWGATTAAQIDGDESGTTTPCGSAPNLACDVGTAQALPFAAGTTAFALGARHTCALHGTTVTCWGDDSAAQTGINAIGQTQTTPNDIPGTWASLYTTRARGQCAVDSAAATWCWGIVLGVYARTVEDPHAEPTLDGVEQIMLGSAFGCALDATGMLSCWGDDSVDEFGDGNMLVGDQPITPLGRSYTKLGVGWSTASLFTCALRPDQTIECWGNNEYGQSGQTDAAGVVNPVVTPFVMPTLTACSDLSLGSAHACAICSGDLYCWGDNRRGQLGSGPPISTPSPQPLAITGVLAPGDAWAQLASGSTFTCARTMMGHVYCWGFASHGGLGIGALSANVPIAVQLAP